MEHSVVPHVTKVRCKLLELRDENLDLFVTAYETFFGVYNDIICKRKGIAYIESDMQVRLERKDKWLEYLMLNDWSMKAAHDQGIPLEVLIEFGFSPIANFNVKHN